MECPSCHFVATPGQSAVEGACPNCERPYRDQPTPLNSDMEMRDMPEPGMEDSGGNPLQEGILGDYQNRGVRDESYASVQHPEEPEFEVTQVIVPDPESIRPDKEQMAKQADFLDDVGGAISDAAPVVAPIAGGVAGFALGGPAGAALGAGLAGGGVSALEGGDVGDVATTGLTDAALGGIGGGAAGAAGKAAESLGAGAAMSTGASEAAAQGATKGGIGAMMKSAWGKVPTQRIKDAYMLNSVSNGVGGQAQQMTTPTPGMVQPGQQQMSPSFYSAVETPTSHGEIPSNDTSDPEEVDYHEKNDGEKDGLQADTGTGDFGGTDLGPDDFFSPDSGAFSSFAELLPKILEYAVSDKSAAGDPDMEELHQKLEAEKPGYMNSADDDHGSKIVMMIVKGNPDGEGNDDSALQDNDAPHDPISEHEASALRPGLETTCETCGGVMDASVSHCPQCGKENGRHIPQPTNPDFSTPQQMMNPPMETTAAGAMTQGPNTDQQKAQVAELLQSEGRGEEVGAMIMEPWNYADELSKITGQEEPPQDIGQPGPPPPVPPGGQEGAMPMPGMSPSGPQSGPSMMAAVKKYATSVDGFCEACPNCGSHSTGYLDYEGGKAGCKTCGHTFDAPKMVEHSAAGEDLHAAPMEPELSQVQPEEQEESGPLGWVDESGSPLKVGQTYEMYSNNYDIPDRITINAVKPDVIEFTLVGEYGLSHQTELTHEEASVEGTTFVPTEGEELDQAPEEAGQGAQPVPGPGDQTDLSTPHELMTARTADFDDINGPHGPNVNGPESINLEPNWDGMKAFILQIARSDLRQAVKVNNEMGSYRVDPMELAQAAGVSLEEVEQLSSGLGEIGEIPETQHPLGPQTGSVIDRMGTAPPLQMNSHEVALAENYSPDVATFFNDDPDPNPPTHEASKEGTGPAWLMDEVAPSAHIAGAHMTPWEQRGYIDEVGDARNADKLQLSGTHYEMDDLADSFLFGL